jgi:hypothetical protein
MMKKNHLLIGILLLSYSVVGQNIIPQKSDSLKTEPKLQYYGDSKKTVPKIEKEEEATKDIIPVVQVKDTVDTKPTEIKYYQVIEVEPKPKEEEKRRNKDQIKTLSGRMSHSGGFGAVSFKTSKFKDKTLVFGGLRGGWIVNRTLAIGIDMYGVIPTTKYDNISIDATKAYSLLGGYGGMFLELIFFSNEVVHITFPVSGGAGWLGYQNSHDYKEDFVDDDVFWYVEPGANLELNIARNFRMAFGVSKRFTQDLVLLNTNSDEFDQINYYLTLKVGGF